MKKVLIIISLIFLLTGCSNVSKLKYDDIANNLATRTSNANTFRTGYKYYLPRGMRVDDSTLYNEVIRDERYTYYLYVDVVSFYNKVKKNYEVNDKVHYSTPLSYKEKFGYIEINLLENDKYLVEIMYNYAKIEVIVDKDGSNLALLSAINILKSVVYNDNIIANLLGDDILNFYEEEFDIFKTHGPEVDDNVNNNYEYIPDKDELPDLDLIN